MNDVCITYPVLIKLKQNNYGVIQDAHTMLRNLPSRSLRTNCSSLKLLFVNLWMSLNESMAYLDAVSANG